MAHLIVRIGSQLPALVDLDGMQQSWPDKDLAFKVDTGARIDGSGVVLDLAVARQNLGRVRAVALAYDTDWDLVRVRAPGASEALVLGPRQILDLSDLRADHFAIEPHFGMPSTRLYDATILRKYQSQSPIAPTGWTAIVGTGKFRNDTGAAVEIKQWSGWNWADAETVAAGAQTTSAAFAGAGAGDRAADFSPDGEWSFADYMEAGLLLNDAGAQLVGVAFASVSPRDSRGQAGDPTVPTTQLYVAQFAKLSTQFYGRLSLEVWTDDECPPRGYVPRLAPVRYVSLAAIDLAGGAAAPNTPIVTVPAINVERAQYIARNSGGGNVFAQLIQPRAEDWIDEIDGVADIDPATGNAFATIASGADGAAFLDEPASPFVKLVLGADGAGSSVAARSVLSLVRREA